MLQRIARIASALAAGNIIYILSQLLLPPAFILAYGVNGYGEWLTLTAGVSWLQGLDFGLQTYIVNELSLEFHRGNLARVRELQSVALRSSAGILGMGLLLTSGVLAAAPLNVLLGLSMTRTAASAIVGLLVAELVLRILWGQLNGMIRSFGYPHRAEAWAQVYGSLLVVTTYCLVLRPAPMWLIPAGRLVVFVGMMAVSLLDLRRLVPQAFPTLAYWDKITAREILRPSLWFGSFTLNQFLVFQAPILILNYVAGKPTVVAFSICRSFYGVVRQLAQIARSSVAPEMTRLAGINDVNQLSRLFTMYEGISFLIGLVGPALALIAAPRVVPLWTRTGAAISIPLFGAMMVTSVVNVAKDTRLALQQATNKHIKSARLCLFTYAGFGIACAPAARLWGPTGIAILWGVVECLQLVIVHFENRTLLPKLNSRRLVTLCVSGALLAKPTAALGYLLHNSRWFVFGLALAAAALILTLFIIPLFGLSDVLIGIRRLRSPFGAEAPTPVEI